MRPEALRRVGASLAAAIAILALLGTAAALSEQPWLAAFDLDGEWNVPSLFSSTLFAVAALLLFHLRGSRLRPPVAVGASALAFFACVDEASQVHEHLEAHFAIDWQRLYVPVFAVAAVLFGLLVMGLGSDRVVRRLLMASAGAWVLALVLEHRQWHGDTRRPGYEGMMVAEEVLEMSGSAVLVLALIRAAAGGQRP